MADSQAVDSVSESEKVFDIQPYQFDPLDPADSNTVQDRPPASNKEIDGVDSTDRCKCGFCERMKTKKESRCCAEFMQIWRKVLDYRDQSHRDKISCITQVDGFEPVCLNPFVLETAYLQFKQEHGDLDTTQEEKFRYTAYRQLVRWCYGILGRSIRVPLPSCAVNRIRKEFPSSGNAYRGFRWIKLGQ